MSDFGLTVMLEDQNMRATIQIPHEEFGATCREFADAVFFAMLGMSFSREQVIDTFCRVAEENGAPCDGQCGGEE